MTGPDSLPPLPPARRAAAWLLLGPLGHLAAGAADWAELYGRYAWARLRGRGVRGA